MGSNTVTVQFNGQQIDVPEGSTIRQLLESAEIRTSPVAVEVNQEIVPHERHATFAVQAGDTIEAVTLVGGG